MPKRITKQELDELATFSLHKEGLGIADLERAAKAAGLDFDRRTLQRRLAELIKAKRVLKGGEGRASRYLLPPITGVAHLTAAPATLVATAEVYVPLSPAGQEVKALVRRPIPERKPVGYNRAFLEGYEPNSSAYLPDSIRSDLHKLGRSPAMERTAGTYARDVLSRLMIDLSWASSRLEGNTYTRLETQNLIELGHAADGKHQREAQMILNHKAAIEMLVEHSEEIDFNTFTFFNLHALLSENLLSEPMPRVGFAL